MEEIEQKLQQNNPVLIVQAITKLVLMIKEKKLKQECRTEGKKSYDSDTSELQMLKSKCADDSPVVSITASQGIIQLVEEGILPVGSTLSDLILNISSAKYCSGITMAIGNLLLVDMRRSLESNKIYVCPFSLQKSQHPFIKILAENPNIWLEVYTQMQMFVDHFDEKISLNSVELLRPAFFFIFCKPTYKLPNTAQQHVWKLLISINNITTHELALEILSWTQLNTRQDYLDICDYLNELTCLSDNSNSDLYSAIIIYLSSLLSTIIKNGDNPVSYIRRILDIIEKYGCDNTHSVILMMLSETVGTCPPIYLKEILRLCNIIISKKCANFLAVKMLTASLLHWLVYPSTLLNETMKYAKEILNFVENNESYSTLTSSLYRNTYFKYILAANPQINTAMKLCCLTETWHHDKKYLIEWLDFILKNINMQITKIFNFISSIFIHEFNHFIIRQKSLQALLKIVNISKEYASKVLVLIIFKLSNEKDPKTQVELLHALPKMAVLKDNVPLILTVLDTLKKESGTLKTVALTLYLHLFLAEVRTFPYLQDILLETNKDPEFSVVKAQTIKQICIEKPELHGKEMVRHLAQILNKHTDQKGSLVSALAIDAVTSLCESEIIDIVSTWGNLAPKFSKEKRFLVVNSLCNFFAGFANVRTISKEHEALKNEAITKLWHYVSYDFHIETLSLALNALSKFNVEEMTLKQLPDLYRQNLILPKVYAKTPEEAAKKPEDVLPYIPGECWVQMLQNINHDVMENAGKLLTEWIYVEISEYRSGVYVVSEGKTEPENYNYLPAKSIVRGIGNAVRLTASGDAKIPLTNRILVECLRILSQTYPKPLPPLNWCFLHELLHKSDEIKQLCINLACKQILISGSALRLIENYAETFEAKTENIPEIKVIFSNLSSLCQALPPNMLRPIITNSLQFAYEMTLRDSSDELFLQLSNDIKKAFLNEKMHDANRTLLGQILETLCDQMDGTTTIFDIFSECIVEGPSKYMERITSPSLWWEVTKDKFERALIIRCKLAMRAEKTPFVWINDCINMASTMKSVQIYLLSNVVNVFRKHRSSLDSGEWLLELLGQIQEALTKEAKDGDQISFMCDVFLVCVIVLVEHDCLASPVEQIVISREVRLSLFPLALMYLCQYKCNNIIVQVLEWLYHMSTCKDISNNYQRAFYQSLILLRHEKAFIESSKWMKYMSLKYPN